jgi:DNA-binding MarR family transcriptional regulator
MIPKVIYRVTIFPASDTMIHGRLNKNEKLVLYGLVKFPLYNDRELSEKIKLKMTTVTAIKNRLKKNGYYYTVRIPVLQNLGCELMMASIMHYNPLKSDRERIKAHNEVLGENVPEIIFSVTEADQGFCLGIAKNFTEVYSAIENLERNYRENEIIESSKPNYYFFPFEYSKIFNFFDYAPIIKHTFNVSLKGDSDSFAAKEMPKTDITKLSNVEKRVLYGLIKYPDIPDSKIAETIDVTRQVVSKLKKSFESDGIIKTLKIPNLKKLGFEIMAVSHYGHNPKIPLEKRGKGIKQVLEDFPQIFMISGNLESLMINICRDFTEFQDLKNKAYGHYKKQEYLIEEPVIMIFSIPNLKTIVEHDYAALLAKILELE